MTLQTGLIITGDVAGASAAVARLTRETQQLKGATDQAGAAAGQAAGNVGRLETEVDGLFGSAAAAASSIGNFAQQIGRLGGAQRQLQQSTGLARTGMQGLAIETGNVGQQLAAGVNPAMAFSQGLTGIILGMQGARAGATGFAGALAGPWGAAAATAISLGGVLVSQLLNMGDASTEAATRQRDLADAADSLGRAQSLLGNLINFTTGKLREQNDTMRTAIVLQARLAQFQAVGVGRESARGLAGMLPELRYSAAQGSLFHAPVAGITPQPTAGSAQQRSQFIGAYNRFLRDRSVTATQFLASIRGTGVDMLQAGQLAVRVEAARNDVTRMGEVGAIARGDLPVPSEYLNLRAGSSNRGTTRRVRNGAAGAQRLGEFGQDAGTRISELAAQFTDTPAQIGRVNRAIADLDDLLEDVQQRRPPNFQQLLEQGRAARQVIQDGINRPYQEFIESQEEGLRIARLESQGRTDEAEALRAILQLEQQSGALSQERRDTILAGVQATRELQRETEILQERQQTYLNTLGEFRGALREAIVGPLQGDFGALARLPQRLLNASAELIGRQIEERIFGDAFRRIEDRINGNDVARDAAERFRDGATEARDASRDAAQALQDLARASRSASGAVAGGGGWWRGVETPALFNDDVPFAWPAGGTSAEGEDGPITVTGARSRSSWPTDPRQFFRGAAEAILTPILGERFAGFVSRGVGSALQGAAFGQIGGGIVNMFGGRSSQTASAVGGALGNIAGEALGRTLGSALGSLGQFAGPIGSIIGSIAGNLLGSALRKSKTGSATITSIDGAATTSGNNAQFRSQASGLAGGVQDALGQIAEQLGGGVGSFAVSIGIRDGKLRVDPSGRGATKTKKGAVDFGEDEAGAVAFAIADAIADGAITGLSQAVQAALRSSPDVNKALREALKVDELETLLAGTAGALNKTFKDFERQAAERLRLAQKYGFDLVKLEELNAKERAALFDQVMKDRIGSLQTLLDDLAFGDLFEGSIADQRQKLLIEIAKAEADATAGTDGAADRVAELRRKLLEISREGFGTAGPEFAADRAGTIASAQEIIRLETERAKEARDAQAATNDHLATANRLADENNDQNAEILAALRVVGSLLGGGASRESGPTTGRTVDL